MGIFDRLSRRTPPSEPVAPEPVPAAEPAALEELRDQVLLWVLPGFNTRDEVLEYAREFRDDDEMQVSDAELEQVVDEVWNARLAEQQTWTTPTDADRVEAAFAALDAAGVVARMNFTCCQTCGVDEIDDERPTDRPSSGYVFFHQQDSERLTDNGSHLYLAYGTLDPIRGQVAEQDTEIGHQITAALRAQNLPVDWNGSSDQRIAVGPLTWHRRLP
ncbi:DUF6891 domain-containing protein [Kribbella sp. CA-293567]|uniref:DUF6891 domain-containing protein n=1 Tax=Kribbella sp. CA-293567 TaxID=3002436 RepID=UPI0022DE0E4A|nr:hypothetical protein [Kribbella sp. CA-293567]WBQ04072.1 hypothetical protein OX958_29410 [Kribbella sp. CA-293567]